MEWAETYQKLNSTERDHFMLAVNRLLAQTFLQRRVEVTRLLYLFVEQHEILVSGYLNLAGWDLIGDRGLGVFQAVNRQGRNRLQLNLTETVLLLLLRLSFEEQQKEVRLNEEAMIRTGGLQEKFTALRLRNRKPLDKRTLRETVGLFKQMQLVKPIDADVTDPECRILIYSTILLAVKVDDIRQLHDRLAAFQQDEAGEEDVL